MQFLGPLVRPAEAASSFELLSRFQRTLRSCGAHDNNYQPESHAHPQLWAILKIDGCSFQGLRVLGRWDVGWVQEYRMQVFRIPGLRLPRWVYTCDGAMICAGEQ